MKENIRTIQLSIAVAEHELDNKQVAEARLPEIELARQRLTLLSGKEIVDALVAMRRSGLPLALDLTPAYRQLTDKPPARQGSIARNTNTPSLRKD